MNKVAIPDDALARFRAAATKFARDASPRASRLLAVKDDIAALRKKGASYRSISELLAQSGIAASDTCVMRFCQRELGEKPVRNSKRKPSGAPKPRAAANGHAAPPTPLNEAAQTMLLDDLLSAAPPNPPGKPSIDGGPRIARIEFAKPGEL